MSNLSTLFPCQDTKDGLPQHRTTQGIRASVCAQSSAVQAGLSCDLRCCTCKPGQDGPKPDGPAAASYPYLISLDQSHGELCWPRPAAAVAAAAAAATARQLHRSYGRTRGNTSLQITMETVFRPSSITILLRWRHVPSITILLRWRTFLTPARYSRLRRSTNPTKLSIKSGLSQWFCGHGPVAYVKSPPL
jgi:hypothetical protein